MENMVIVPCNKYQRMLEAQGVRRNHRFIHHHGNVTPSFLRQCQIRVDKTYCRSYRSIHRRALFTARVDCVDQLTVDLSIVSIDTIEGGLFRPRVDCVDQLTVDHIDRYDRTGLFRARVDCVDQLTVDRIN